MCLCIFEFVCLLGVKLRWWWRREPFGVSEWQRDGERGWKDAACAAGGVISKGQDCISF